MTNWNETNDNKEKGYHYKLNGKCIISIYIEEENPLEYFCYIKNKLKDNSSMYFSFNSNNSIEEVKLKCLLKAKEFGFNIKTIEV